MEKSIDDDIIQDIRKVASKMNTNFLTEREYYEHGGVFSEEVIDY